MQDNFFQIFTCETRALEKAASILVSPCIKLSTKHTGETQKRETRGKIKTTLKQRRSLCESPTWAIRKLLFFTTIWSVVVNLLAHKAINSVFTQKNQRIVCVQAAYLIFSFARLLKLRSEAFGVNFRAKNRELTRACSR